MQRLVSSNTARRYKNALFGGKTRVSRRKRIALLWAIVAIVIAASVILATSLTVAYYSSLSKGWAQEAAIAGISFCLNGEDVGNISTYSPNLLYRGDEDIMNLETSVIGTATGTTEVEYAIYFELFADVVTDGNTTPDVQRTAVSLNNGVYSSAICEGQTIPEFARAIEVYEYVGGDVVATKTLEQQSNAEAVTVVDTNGIINNKYYSVTTTGGEYRFVGMLDKLLTSPQPFILHGSIGCGDTDTHTLKLVYSAAAGEYYESQRVPFTIRVTAVPIINKNSDNYYILSKEDLETAAAGNTQLYGKTIKLIENITLDEDISLTNVGLDLNGHKLDLNGKTLSISFDNSFDMGDLSIIGGDVEYPLGENGTLSINCGIGVIPIDDRLKLNERISVTYGNEALKAAIQSCLDSTAAQPFKTSNQSIDITKNLKWYIKNNTTLSFYYEDLELTANTDGSYPITHGEMTEVQSLDFTLRNLSEGNSYSSGGTADLTVIGKGLKAIADNYINTLPDTLDCSIFLPEYDADTKSRLTWVTSDKKYLTKDGLFVSGGYENLTGTGAWTDKFITLGVIAETDGVRSYSEKQVRIEILTPEERTAIIYDYINSTLSSVGWSQNEKPNEDFLVRHIDSLIDAQRAGLVGLSIKEITDPLNIKNGSLEYLKVEHISTVNEEGSDQTLGGLLELKPKITLDNPLTTHSVLHINTQIDFTYSDHTAQGEEVTVDAFVTIIGDKDISALNDITDELQTRFSDNSYVNFTNATDYRTQFYVKGVSDDGDMINYELSNIYGEDYSNYIDIENGIFVSDENGAFVHVQKTVTDDFVSLYRNTDGSSLITTAQYLALPDSEPDEGEWRGDYERYTDEVYQNSNGELSTINANDFTILCNRYDRCSRISVSNAFVPPYDHTAYLNAYVVEQAKMADNHVQFTYTEDISNRFDNGSSDYNCYTSVPINITPNASDAASYVNGYFYLMETVNDSLQRVFYEMSLDVTGIYHYTEIPDTNLYAQMRNFCNSNGDLFISTKEAAKTMSDMIGKSTGNKLNTAEPYDYLDLSDKNITSIEGLEYFTGVSGYDFSGNSIIGISALANVRNLRYLDFTDNNITDIEALSLLDNLSFLNLSNTNSNNENNIITDLEPLRYLENIKYLDLTNNNNLSSIEPISEYKNLVKLIAKQADNGKPLQVQGDNRYYFTLIKSSSNPQPVITLNSDPTITNEQINKALALSELKLINETYNTLFLPATYTYGNTTYNLEYLSSDVNRISINNNNVNNNMVEYVINSPVVDQDIKITVKIKDYDTISRSFDLNLMRLNTDPPALLRDDEDVLHTAQEAIPDAALRAALYETFSNKVTVENTTYEGNTQNYNVLDVGLSGDAKDLLCISSGITDLTGLEYFRDDISTLNLSGNKIKNGDDGYPDISQISEISSLTHLTLSGQKYDFSQISKYSENNTPPESGLTSLEILDVSGCYGLDEDFYIDTDGTDDSYGVLNGLFMVYLANPEVDIYKDEAYVQNGNAEIWDPYAIPLARYMKALPSAFVFSEPFVNSATINDGKLNGNMFLTEDNIKRAYVTENDGKYFYTFNFYGVKSIDFEIAKADVTYNDDTVISGNGETAIKGTDSGKTTKSETDSNNYMRYQYDNTGIHMDNAVSYSDTDYTVFTLYGNDDTGRGLVSGTHYVELKLEFNRNYKIRINGIDYPLDEVIPGRDLRTKIIDNNIFSSDNPTYVYSGIGGENPTPIPINIDLSFTTTGSYLQSGSSAIQGLQYTTVNDLTIERDAYLGTGEWLQNIQTLTIYYSGVDFSTIDRKLENLTTLNIGTTDKMNVYTKLYDSSIEFELYEYINALITASLNGTSVFNNTTVPTGNQIDELRTIVRSVDNGKYRFYLNYLPNLVTFNSYLSNISDWRFMLSFLFKSDTSDTPGTFDSNSLQKLTIHRLDETNSNRTANNNINANSDVTEAIVRQIYYNSAQSDLNFQIGVKYYPDSDEETGRYKASIQTTTYNPATWHTFNDKIDPNLSQKTNNDVSSVGDRKYYTLVREADEFKEFAENIPDLGVYINVEGTLTSSDTPPIGQSGVTATRYIESNDAIVAAGSVIYLPHSMEDTGFFYTPGDTEHNFMRDTAITWTLDYSSGDDITIDTTNNEYYTILTTITEDTMFIFKGTLSYEGIAESYTFLYPITVTGTSSPTYISTYTTITDPRLRFAVFCQLGGANTITTNPSVLNFDAALTGNAEQYATYYNEYTSGILSLNGLGQFDSLTSLTLTNNYVNDISALSEMTSLSTLNLSGNLISDVSYLSTCTGLTTIDLSNNKIREIPSGWASGFSSLEALNLNNNGLISHIDICRIANSLPDVCAFSTLKIFGTRAAGYYTTGVVDGNDDAVDTISALSKIISKNNNSVVLTAASEDTAVTVTATMITALNAYTLGNNEQGANNNPLEYRNIRDNKTFLKGQTISFDNLYNGYSCTNLTFLDKNVYDPNSTAGNKSAVNAKGMQTFDTWIKLTFNGGENNDLFVYEKIEDLQATGSGSSVLRFKLSAGGYSDPYHKSDFDPALFTYIITKLSNEVSTIDGNTTFTIPYWSSQESPRKIEINAENGFTSLKGLELIPGDIEVTICDNELFNSLDIGAPANGNAIKSITLDGITIDEGGMQSISNCTALTTLDLRGATGIDYLLTQNQNSSQSSLNTMMSVTEIQTTEETTAEETIIEETTAEETTAEETTVEETTAEETTIEETTAEETTIEETTAEETTVEDLIVLETIEPTENEEFADGFVSEPKRGLFDSIADFFGFNDEEETTAEETTAEETTGEETTGEEITEGEIDDIEVDEPIELYDVDPPAISYSYNTLTGDNLATIISGLSNLTKLQINNEYNYFNSYGNSATEYINDLNYYNANNALNTVTRINFGSVLKANADFVNVYNTGSDDCTHTYITRSRTAKIQANEQWWLNNAITDGLYGRTLNLFNSTTDATDFNFSDDDNFIGLAVNINALTEYISAFAKNSSGRTLMIANRTENLLNKNWIYYTDMAQTATDSNNVVWNGITFYLPNSFKLFGQDVTITWSAETSSLKNACIAYVETPGSLLTRNTATTKFCLYDVNNSTLDFEYLDTITLKASISFNGRAYNIERVFTIFRQQSYNPVDEIQSDNTSDYYFELTDGILTPANEIFESSRLIDWLFDWRNKVNNKNYGIRSDYENLVNDTAKFVEADNIRINDEFQLSDHTLVTSGKYYSMEKIASVQYMNINSGGNSIGALSFVGMEIFTNLKNLTINKGYPVSLEPFSNMQLHYFVYTNSNSAATNNVIQDFSPLYNSRSTLKTFEYGSNGFHHTDELSFLISFNALRTIKIDTDGENQFTGISQMPWFRYVCAIFAARNIEKLTAGTNATDCTTITVNGHDYVKNNGTYDEAALTPQLRRAAEILGQLEGGHEYGVDYVNGFEIILNGNSTFNNLNNAYTAHLPADINIGGQKYPIEWITMSSFISVSSSITPADEDGYFTDGANRTWTMTITDKNNNLINQAYLICRVKHEDSYYDRVLVFDCRDNFEYKIRYNYNYGETESTETEQLKAYQRQSLITPVREGYHYLGWYADVNTDNNFVGMSITQSQLAQLKLLMTGTNPPILNLYAGWREYYNYNVHLYTTQDTVIPQSIPGEWSQNGVLFTSNAANSGSTFTLPAAEYVTRDGYTFNGWYTSNASNGTQVSTSSINWHNNSTDVTYYAHWVNNYTLNLNLNGGSAAEGSTAFANMTYNTNVYTKLDNSPLVEYILPVADDMTYANHVFMGWYDNPEFTGDPIASIPTDDSGERIIVSVYAKWLSLYSVTLNLKGGSINDGSTYFEGWTETADVLSKEGFSPAVELVLPGINDLELGGKMFGGWYDNPTFEGTAVVRIPVNQSDNVELYAKWINAVTRYYVVVSEVNKVTKIYSDLENFSKHIQNDLTTNPDYIAINNPVSAIPYNVNCAYELKSVGNGKYKAYNVPKNEDATFSIYRFDDDGYTLIPNQDVVITNGNISGQNGGYSIPDTSAIAYHNRAFDFGAYNFEYDINDKSLTATRPLFTYSLCSDSTLGSWKNLYNYEYNKDNGSGWPKPNINYIFNYDSDNDLYYLNIATPENSGINVKITGAKSDRLYEFSSMTGNISYENGAIVSGHYYWVDTGSARFTLNNSKDQIIVDFDNSNISSVNIALTKNKVYRIYLDPAGKLEEKLSNITGSNLYIYWEFLTPQP